MAQKLHCFTLRHCGHPRRSRVGFKEGEINFRFQNSSQCGSDFWAPPGRGTKSYRLYCARVGKRLVDHREEDSDRKAPAPGILMVELESNQGPHEGQGIDSSSKAGELVEAWRRVQTLKGSRRGQDHIHSKLLASDVVRKLISLLVTSPRHGESVTDSA